MDPMFRYFLGFQVNTARAGWLARQLPPVSGDLFAGLKPQLYHLTLCTIAETMEPQPFLPGQVARAFKAGLPAASPISFGRIVSRGAGAELITAGSLAAIRQTYEAIVARLAAEDIEPMHDDVARLGYDRTAFAGMAVQRLAVDLQRRIDRRHLTDRATETGQHRVDPRIQAGLVDRPLGDDLAFGIVGGRGDPQPDDGPVGLVTVERRRGELAGLAEQHRQQAARERIEGPAVAGLVGLEQPPRLLHGRVRRQAERLVEQQQAVDLQTAVAPGELPSSPEAPPPGASSSAARTALA